jgi:hypothetical protein
MAFDEWFYHGIGVRYSEHPELVMGRIWISCCIPI